jgi:acyl-CoA synthetase (AMP-forming)/AMP-acid ligase II/thioesterase domain-containing protein
LRRTAVQRPGQIVLTHFDSHYENILWFWSVIAAGGVGAIISPLSNEPKAAAGQLQNIKNLFRDSPLITNDKFAQTFAAQGLNVMISSHLENQGQKEPTKPADAVTIAPDPNDIATILFTSGSTGHSKAVQYSHYQLIASAKAKVNHLGSDGTTFMSWISFDHSANFCEVHLQSMFASTDQVHVPTSELVVEPYRFYKLLSDFQIGYTFTPNFFLASATRSFRATSIVDVKTWNLSKLKTIMCAGEANRTETLAAADEVLRELGAPPHSIRAAYGLSETCSACFYCLETPQYDVEHGNRFASAGSHLPDVLEMKVLAEDGSGSDEGVLHLRGTLIFKGYYKNPAATEQCMTSEGWFNTGDIARVDENGNLHLLGRQKEILILHGNNYSSFELEYSLETSGITGLTTSYTAVFSTWDERKQSEAVVVVFNPTEEATGPKKLRETLRAIDRVVFNFASERALHLIPLPKSLLPKSTIGKLSRAQLKKEYEVGAFDDYLADELLSLPGFATVNSTSPVLGSSVKRVDSPQRPMEDSTTPMEREVAAVFASVLNVPVDSLLHGGDDALLSSGLNSLRFIQVKRYLEKALDMDREIPMQTLTRCTSVSQLAHELTLMGTTSAEYDPVVPLVTKGSKQTLFLLPPGAGEFLCWLTLLEYLPDRPLYAVRARGLHGPEPVFSSLKEMLDIYYAAIRRTQPHGPYALFGYCWGGLLAFELGKMFIAAGEQVVFCGGLDNPPDIRRALGHVRYRSVLSDFIPALTGMSPEEAKAFMDETSEMEDPEFYEAIHKRLPPAVLQENGGLTVQRIKAYGKVEDCHRRMAWDYQPHGKVPVIDIFAPNALPLFDTSGFESWRAVLDQWQNHADDTRVHAISGNHYTVLKQPDILDFQKALNKALDARGV